MKLWKLRCLGTMLLAGVCKRANAGTPFCSLETDWLMFPEAVFLLHLNYFTNNGQKYQSVDVKKVVDSAEAAFAAKVVTTHS